MERKITLSTGTVAWVTAESVTFDGNEYQQIASSRQDYGYTHGGKEYQEACEQAWELFR